MVARASLEEAVVVAARAFVEQFVSQGKRRRLLKLLDRPRTHADFLRELDHIRWLDDARATLLSRDTQSTDQIEALLRSRGAPATCTVVSSAGAECGVFRLDDALTNVVGGTSGAIVSCIPGRLAYYEAEEPFVRYLCVANEGV